MWSGTTTVKLRVRPCHPDLNVNTLTSILKGVSEWEMFGLELGVEWAKIKAIRIIRRDMNPHLCMADLLDHWLEHNLEASWEGVITALEEIGMACLARDIREKYHNGGVSVHIYQDACECA